MAGLKLPISTIPLQALVTEPVRPVFDTVMMSARIHAYVSQSDRGEIVIGGGADLHNSYAQRGSLATQLDTLSALLELLPMFGRLRMMRQWAGTCDMAPDVSRSKTCTYRPAGEPGVTRPFPVAATHWPGPLHTIGPTTCCGRFNWTASPGAPWSTREPPQA
jgi:hypothetical protein